MPDIFTHLMLGLSLGVIWKQEKKEDFLLLLIGSVLIDTERPFSLLFSHFFNVVFTKGFHSLLGALVLSSFVAWVTVIEDRSFKDKFILVFVGCLTHLLADMTFQKWEELGIYLLYPLRIPFSFNLVWSDFIWFPIIGIGIFLLSLFGRYLYDNTIRQEEITIRELLWINVSKNTHESVFPSENTDTGRFSD